MEEGSNGKRTSSPPQLIVDERPVTQVTTTSPTSRARMNRGGAVSNRTLWQPFDCGYERCEAAAVKHEQKPSRPPIKKQREYEKIRREIFGL
ncbi:hypothetical protein BX661DRAFT_198024 [Kickxella alabastrina]|uniref:uncharacterized protein n=1 Tax=Kickxella alabastrina TaxID=61397 RepID=UPI0022210360|nr:uncharacterized protein BX661DRAFT_198024 [Kickxella alabastrina]KAI7829248.1 hypothetical protein BX661DRAFT_198024 [Kickxella alabastrina]